MVCSLHPQHHTVPTAVLNEVVIFGAFAGLVAGLMQARWLLGNQHHLQTQQCPAEEGLVLPLFLTISGITPSRPLSHHVGQSWVTQASLE